ncbi:S-methyl-5-thioribose-1-phosphate isomerase [Coprothermobacteraceae bacterium]|nr:S-methyl-5-thioribose-1-phosphate isomerase [Coprothermobacteraceae bacterium]
MIKPLEYDRERGTVVVLDQTRLPHEEVYLQLDNFDQLVEAIRSLRIRGAPLLGLAGAYGLVLAVRECEGLPDFKDALMARIHVLVNARPTAVNLRKEVEEILSDVNLDAEPYEIAAMVFEKIVELEARLQEDDLRLSLYGADLLRGKTRILTICNTGSLATGGIGTALGIIKVKHQRHDLKIAYLCETRPVLQGARLSAWELSKEGVPHYLITDNTAPYLMSLGEVDAVVVGADRITRNGDTANKIGTLMLAVAAKRFGVPFYVAAPTSSFDLSLESGSQIPIEQRDPSEVLMIGGTRIAPESTKALNYAFDVTPAELIDAYITEAGILKAPFDEVV